MKLFLIGLLISSAALAQTQVTSVVIKKYRPVEPGMVGGVPMIETDKGTFKFENNYLKIDRKFTGRIDVMIEDRSDSPGQFGGIWANPVFMRTTSISFCETGMMGCASRIDIDGEPMIYEGLSEEVNKQLNSLHSAGKSKEVTVAGVVVFEDGHFPNPMAHQSVFKVLKVSYDSKGVGKEKEIDSSGRSSRKESISVRHNETSKDPAANEQ